MIYYSTGKGTYKRGEVGAAVETDEATAKVLIEKGYLTESNKIVETEVKNEPEIPKKRGNPNWGKNK
jgi:hypothetical protein